MECGPQILGFCALTGAPACSRDPRIMSSIILRFTNSETCRQCGELINVYHRPDTDRGPRLLLRAAAVALFMVPALEGAAGAGPLDDARTADRRGDYVTEFRLLRPLALQGNAEAQTALGLIYDAGRGVAQDYVEAVKWYRCAADQGFTDAGAGFNVEAGYAGRQYRRRYDPSTDHRSATTCTRVAGENSERVSIRLCV